MSLTNKKRVSLSPQRSIKEHLDEKNDDNNIDKNTHHLDISVEEIHTMNDWEHADLGDEQRKQKFLRLMGGAKKRKDVYQPDVNHCLITSHDPLLVSEKKHCRTKAENEAINLELEKQFNEGLQSNILHKNHEGFGFHGCDTPSSSNIDDSHYHTVKTHFIPAATTDKNNNRTLFSETFFAQ